MEAAAEVRAEVGATVPAVADGGDGESRWPHAPVSWPERETFSAPWMVPWLEAAAASLSVAEACRRAGVGLAEYLLARREDMAFDRAAMVFDQIVELMIRESVRQGALDGDPQMARLYFTKVRLPAFLPPFVSYMTRFQEREPVPDQIPPHVLDAMLEAAHRAAERGR